MTHLGPERAPRPLYMRLLWFALFWLGGVAVIGAIAFLLRRLLL